MLSETERDFSQEDEEGLNADTKLADIVNKRWSSKLTDNKLKEKWRRLAGRELSKSPSSKGQPLNLEQVPPAGKATGASNR